MDRTKRRSFADEPPLGRPFRLSRDIVGLDLAAEVEVPGLHPRQLARACPGKRSRRNQLDHRRDAGDRTDALADLVAQAAALLITGNAAVDEDGGSVLARGA